MFRVLCLTFILLLGAERSYGLLCDTPNQLVEYLTELNNGKDSRSILDAINRNAGRNVCGTVDSVYIRGDEITRMRVGSDMVLIVEIYVGGYFYGQTFIRFPSPLTKYTLFEVGGQDV